MKSTEFEDLSEEELVILKDLLKRWVAKTFPSNGDIGKRVCSDAIQTLLLIQLSTARSTWTQDMIDDDISQIEKYGAMEY